MSNGNKRNGYTVRTFNLLANTPQPLPSAREFLLVTASVNTDAISIAIGDDNGDLEQWPLGFAVGVKEGSTRARVMSTITQTVTVAMADGSVQVVDSRLAPGPGTIDVNATNQPTEAVHVANTETGGGVPIPLVVEMEPGAQVDMNLAEIDGTAVANGGVAGLLGVGISRIAGGVAISGGVTGSLAVGGVSADSAAAFGNPVQVGGVVINNPQTRIGTNNAARMRLTPGRSVTVKPYAPPGSDWFADGVITDSAAPVLASAGVANYQKYVTGLQLSSEVMTNALNFEILDNATPIFSVHIPAGVALPPTSFTFPTPLSAGLGLAVNVQTNIASGAGSLWWNIQGYQE